MIDIVNEYNKYIETLPELISKTYYKTEYFVRELCISQATYYRKLRENAFTAQEVSILTKLLFPKQAYLEEIKAELASSKEDIKQGSVIEHSEAMKAIRKDYL